MRYVSSLPTAPSTRSSAPSTGPLSTAHAQTTSTSSSPKQASAPTPLPRHLTDQAPQEVTVGPTARLEAEGRRALPPRGGPSANPLAPPKDSPALVVVTRAQADVPLALVAIKPPAEEGVAPLPSAAGDVNWFSGPRQSINQMCDLGPRPLLLLINSQ
mmetsp:Transcript_27215/g.44367  ORF Transcript_27215/g.44367 Transcript_27215/m.44367 type:complete len:158 (+) Transcript_27215:1191-1664(+)